MSWPIYKQFIGLVVIPRFLSYSHQIANQWAVHKKSLLFPKSCQIEGDNTYDIHLLSFIDAVTRWSAWSCVGMCVNFIQTLIHLQCVAGDACIVNVRDSVTNLVLMYHVINHVTNISSVENVKWWVLHPMLPFKYIEDQPREALNYFVNCSLRLRKVTKRHNWPTKKHKIQ